MAMQCNAVTTITVTTSDLKHLLFPGSCLPSLISHSHFPWFLLSSYLNLFLRKMIYSPSEKPKMSVSLLLLIYIIHITYTPKNHLTHLIFHITVITGRMQVQLFIIVSLQVLFMKIGGVRLNIKITYNWNSTLLHKTYLYIMYVLFMCVYFVFFIFHSYFYVGWI